MSTCLARQPIFDTNLNVYGYELLFRSSEASKSYDGTDPDQASSETIMLSLDIGARRLTGNRMAFINFTENLLLNEVATILPRNFLVVEILETVNPSEEVLEACKKLKKQGYLLSVDDYEYSESNLELLELADIVKIDFLKYTNTETLKKEVEKIKARLHKIGRLSKTRLLAEKVESQEAYAMAKEIGFSYFQGYFFSKPEIFSKKTIYPMRVNQLRLVREAMDPMVDYKRLAETIGNDPILSYRILRLVNSAYYGLRYRLSSIKHALAVLGIENIKKYVTLLTIEQMTDDKPDELCRMSLIRGHFLESLAPLVGMRKAKNDLFLLGLFSLMDIMTGVTMQEVVELTQLSENIAVPLLTGKGKKADMLNLIVSYEQGSFDNTGEMAMKYGLSLQVILELYLDAVEWSDELFDYTYAKK